MVILFSIPFGQAVIQEPLVVEFYPKTGVFTWDFFSRPMNMKELSLLFDNTWSKYDHIFSPCIFNSNISTFLWFKIFHLGIIKKRRSRECMIILGPWIFKLKFFHIHRPWKKKFHAKNSPVLGSITLKDWSTEILCSMTMVHILRNYFSTITNFRLLWCW